MAGADAGTDVAAAFSFWNQATHHYEVLIQRNLFLYWGPLLSNFTHGLTLYVKKNLIQWGRLLILGVQVFRRPRGEGTDGCVLGRCGMALPNLLP